MSDSGRSRNPVQPYMTVVERSQKYCSEAGKSLRRRSEVWRAVAVFDGDVGEVTSQCSADGVHQEFKVKSEGH